MILTALLTALLHLLILTPFFLVAKRSGTSSLSLQPIFYFIVVFLASALLITSLSTVSIFPGQMFNWVGKGAALVFLLVCAFTIPAVDNRHFGLTGKIQWEGTRPVLLICAVYLLLRIVLYCFSGEASFTIHPETILFQATLPGLQEELLYRGILLGLLNSVFTRSIGKFANVDFGWAVIITSILFGLEHGISFGSDFAINVNYFNFFRTAFEGFLFALLAQKTKSIFPSVISHNLLNLVSNH